MTPFRASRADKYNLVLVLWHEHARTRADFTRIAELVPRIDPRVRTFVIAHHKLDQISLLPIWWQPTLALSFVFIDKRKLLPGRLLTGTFLQKHEQYVRLTAAGIQIPDWTIISPETCLDPAVWGPYVVEKPSAGRRAAHVRIRRTSRVRHVAPELLPAGHYGRDGPMLAQRFIYTGEWPTSYRVVTLFGEVLLCYRQISRGHGCPLTGRWNFRETGGINIASNTKDMTVEFAEDRAVIELAERAHREAFGDIPVLAFDIIRDAETGTLYVLECHPGGTWMFSSDVALGIEAANNINLKRQFDALGKAAQILARETPLRAAISWPWPDERRKVERIES
jgi:hypothetical protein